MNSVLKIVSALTLSLSRTPREEDEQSDFVPMIDLAINQLRSIVGGDGDVVAGTPRGGWGVTTTISTSTT